MIEYINRRGSNCYKWDSEHAKDTLPLWVADMDFKVAPAIIDALHKRVDHGAFGYQLVPQEYYDAVESWFSRRHQWHGVTRDKIIYTIGVVPAISAILRAKTKPCDKVLLFTPAYNCFFSSIRNLECEALASPLLNIDNHYEIYWEDFEKKASQATILLLCNPHNPVGRVWTREEMQHIAEIAAKHHIFVISDEIHCEFCFLREHYTPYATVCQDDNYCVCISPSKAFNIAGLQVANIFVPNAANREAIDRAINIHEICDVGVFGVTALIAAYNESEQWIDELNEYIYNNYCFLRDFLQQHLPMLTLTRMEGTYLAWVGIEKLLTPACPTAEALCEQLATEQHVLFNPSEMYGSTNYIRLNLATSQDILNEALLGFERFILKRF